MSRNQQGRSTYVTTLHEVTDPPAGGFVDTIIVAVGKVDHAQGEVDVDVCVEYRPVVPAHVQIHQLSGLARGSPAKFFPSVLTMQLGTGWVETGDAAADASSACCSSQ